jgi:ADP-ribose pyrophosphatase YjhB (NUDIX family)
MTNASCAYHWMTVVSWSAVTEQLVVAVGRRAARAILIDEHDRLVLIRRTKPGQAPYWTAPGGGVDATDASVEAALHRELAEELGAEASGAARVFSAPRPMLGWLFSTSSWLG